MTNAENMYAWWPGLDGAEYPVYAERCFYHQPHAGKVNPPRITLLGIFQVIVDRDVSYMLTNSGGPELLMRHQLVFDIKIAVLRRLNRGWIIRTDVQGDGVYIRFSARAKSRLQGLNDSAATGGCHE